jgi:predicted DNA-binding transcriptional regulator YafY
LQYGPDAVVVRPAHIRDRVVAVLDELLASDHAADVEVG